MTTRLKASDLDRRVTVQKKATITDPEGIPVEGWADVVTIWAARRTLRGREYFAAAAVNAENTVRFEIRYRTGILADMRLIDLKDNRTYNIHAVLDDVQGDRTETHLMTTEELRNG